MLNGLVAQSNGKAANTDTANSIVNDGWFQNRLEKREDETRRIVRAAGKIIAFELQSLTYITDVYPTDEEISDLNLNKDWLLDNLRIFMETLVKINCIK